MQHARDPRRAGFAGQCPLRLGHGKPAHSDQPPGLERGDHPTKLAIAGGVDMVSVYVRQSLIQLATPDAMRGRVAAVSFVFISASNELGDFEAGLMARIFGPVLAVTIGGVGAVAASLGWMRLFPELAKADGFELAASSR